MDQAELHQILASLKDQGDALKQQGSLLQQLLEEKRTVPKAGKKAKKAITYTWKEIIEVWDKWEISGVVLIVVDT